MWDCRDRVIRVIYRIQEPLILCENSKVGGFIIENAELAQFMAIELLMFNCRGSMPTIDNLVVLARVLGVTIDEIIVTRDAVNIRIIA